MNEPWTPALHTLAENKDVRALLRQLAEAGGWVGRYTRSGHIRLRHEGGAQITIPGTPSDHRALRNALADVRRVHRAAQQ